MRILNFTPAILLGTAAYKGAHTGMVWREFWDLMSAFDVQNEPFFNPKGKCTVSDREGKNRLCDRATNMRKVLGPANPIKIASGGIGGSAGNGCPFLNKTMDCGALGVIGCKCALAEDPLTQ